MARRPASQNQTNDVPAVAIHDLLACFIDMKATILDTVTGEKMTVDGPRSWEWAENGWTCDCNRNPWGIDTGGPPKGCHGWNRFLVVEAVMNDPDDYEYTLAELNAGYPEALLAKFLPANI